MPNIEIMAKAIKLAWIARFLSVDQLYRSENWKVIPEYYFDKVGDLNFLL